MRRRGRQRIYPALLAGLLTGCVRTLELAGPSDPADTDTDTLLDTDTGEDTDGPSPDAVCVPGQGEGFIIPHARWALAVLHASRMYDNLDDSTLALSPAWFLASAWQGSAFSCAEYGLPWDYSSKQDTPEGCLAIEESTIWSELSRLYPGIYDKDGYDGAVSGDHVEAAVMALTWFTVSAHVLIQMNDVNPDEWYATAADPLAVEKLSAIMHNQGPWTSLVGDILVTCPDNIDACLSDEAAWYVSGMTEKLQLLGSAECYDAPLSEADVRQYVDGLSAVWPREDWVAIEAAALAARTDAGFATAATAVLDAIDENTVTRLRCPEEELWAQFRLSCP